jgi:regulator of protease activity HflC (stomatin/prohibitin superfamily)
MKIQVDDQVISATSEQIAEIETARAEAIQRETEAKAKYDALITKLVAQGLTEEEARLIVSGS